MGWSVDLRYMRIWVSASKKTLPNPTSNHRIRNFEAVSLGQVF